MDLVISVIAILVGFFVGGAREKRHFEELKVREGALLARLPTRADRGSRVQSVETFLVTGNVVIAADSFKTFVGGLKSFFGGSMGVYETMLDRARREAVCRLRESAVSQGATEIVDLHIETSYLDQLGVEVSAYGTAIRA
jgi:uncharacterized protein YbjQ (UPF0145 family)